jgi:hypothetical protein
LKQKRIIIQIFKNTHFYKYLRPGAMKFVELLEPYEKGLMLSQNPRKQPTRGETVGSGTLGMKGTAREVGYED